MPDADPTTSDEKPARDAREMVVYTASGCCLCDDARVALDRLAPELGIAVRWIHIDGDPALEARWREEIPVGLLDGRKMFKYRVDEERLRRHAARPVA